MSGLQLTTRKIRSGSLHKSKGEKSNRNLSKTYMLSVSRAKKEKDKKKKQIKVLDMIEEILSECSNFLKPIDYDELIDAVKQLDKTYVDKLSHSTLTGGSSSSSSSNTTTTTTTTKDVPGNEKDKKIIMKAQNYLKNKLDRLTKVMKAMDSVSKSIAFLKKKTNEEALETAEFKRSLCVGMKANYDPLFAGGVGYEHSKRTDPYGDNLSTSVWDSKTSKTTTLSTRDK